MHLLSVLLSSAAVFSEERTCMVLAQERTLLAFRRFSGVLETSLRVMAKAMRAAAMKAMKVVSKAAKEQAFVATKAMRKAKAAAPAPKKAMK